MKRRKSLALAIAFTLSAGFLTRSYAVGTRAGEETIWDQIMASQVQRGLSAGLEDLNNKDYDQALKEFLRAVQANPKDPQAHMMLGVAYYWTGSVDSAIDEYRQSLNLDATSSQAQMLLGIALAWREDIQGAYEAFKKSVELDGRRSDSQMNLGSIEDSLGMVPEALDHFRKAVELSPREPLYHFQLGELYARLGRDQDAVASFKEGVRLFPDYEDAILELGAAEERRGNPSDALKDYEQAVEIKPGDSVARLRLGRLLLVQGKTKQARAVFAQAFHLTPEGSGKGLQLSVSFSGDQGKKPAQPESAARGKDKAGEASKESEAPKGPLDVFKRNLDRVPLEQGAVLEADVIFVPRPQLSKEPAHEGGSVLQKALGRAEKKNSSGSPSATRRTYRLDAGSPEERRAQIAKILSDLSDLLGKAPQNSDVHLGMNLTYTHLEKEDSQRRGDEKTPPVTYQPRQVGNDMGLWVMGTGWMSLVEETLPDGVAGADPAFDPKRGDWWVEQGLAYATLGDGKRSLGAFKQACDLAPDDEIAWLGLGVSSVLVGDESGAVTALRRALKLNPKDGSAQDGLKWLLKPSAQEAKGEAKRARGEK